MAETHFELRHLVVPHPANDFRPHLLRHHYVAIYIAILIAYELLAGTILNAPVVTQPVKQNAIESEMLTQVNDLRQRSELKPLHLNPLLTRAATAKLKDMIARRYFDHTSPSGKKPWDFISDQGYAYSAAGENIARGFMTGGQVISAWQASPEHLKNLLSSDYSETGMAVMTDTSAPATTYFEELFAAPAPAGFDGAITLQIITQSGHYVPVFSILNAFAGPKLPVTLLALIVLSFFAFDAYMLRRLGKLFHFRHWLAFTVAGLLGVILLALTFVNIAQTH